MNIHELNDEEFQQLVTGLNQDLGDEHRRIAQALADLLLSLGEAAEDPIVRPRLIDAVLAAVPDKGDRARILWQAQRPVLAASIAQAQGVPWELIAAEARQRLAIDDLAAVGMEAAQAAEAERIRLALESGWCSEMECRNRLTDCTDACCWHCGRANHRAAFSAAQHESARAEASLARLTEYLTATGWERKDHTWRGAAVWTHRTGQVVSVPETVEHDAELRILDAIEGIARAEGRDRDAVAADLDATEAGA